MSRETAFDHVALMNSGSTEGSGVVKSTAPSSIIAAGSEIIKHFPLASQYKKAGSGAEGKEVETNKRHLSLLSMWP